MFGTVAQTPAAVWRRQLEINVIAVAELTRLLLPALRRARGRVVLINSGAGPRADALRAEEAEHGIRVTGS